MTEKERQLDAWFEWHKSIKHKHRTMTLGEHRAWLNGGDMFSGPYQSNPFPGGLTILLNTPSAIGLVGGWVDPPQLDDTITSTGAEIAS